MKKIWHITSMMNNMPLVQDQNIICDARAPNKMAKNAVPLQIFLLSTLRHTTVSLLRLKALPNRLIPGDSPDGQVHTCLDFLER